MSVRLAGRALHAGGPSAVTLGLGPGPTRLEAEGASVPLAEARLVRTDHGVAVALGEGGPVIDLVEHLLAAIGALGAHEGLVARVEGGEPPSLGGGALGFARAIAGLALPPRVWLRIARPFRFALGPSAYALEPGDAPRLAVSIAFDHPAIGAQSAAWQGDRGDFLARIAPARTFGFVRDHAALLAAGRARGATLGELLVFDEQGVAPGCAPAGRDEPARHKLLDLAGDLALYGGPPLGLVTAHRPGHGPSHAMIRAALAEGALLRGPCAP